MTKKWLLVARQNKHQRWKTIQGMNVPTTKPKANKQLVEVKTSLKTARKSGLIDKKSGHEIKIIPVTSTGKNTALKKLGPVPYPPLMKYGKHRR